MFIGALQEETFTPLQMDMDQKERKRIYIIVCYSFNCLTLSFSGYLAANAQVYG